VKKKLNIDDIIKLNDGKTVRIIRLRDESYMYPVWFVDIKTGITGGCKFEDINKKIGGVKK